MEDEKHNKSTKMKKLKFLAFASLQQLRVSASRHAATTTKTSPKKPKTSSAQYGKG